MLRQSTLNMWLQCLPLCVGVCESVCCTADGTISLPNQFVDHATRLSHDPSYTCVGRSTVPRNEDRALYWTAASDPHLLLQWSWWITNRSHTV